MLSGYPRPATTPTVEFVPQAFFNENACHHRECHVWGWYPNTGLDVIYVHEAVRELMADGSDERSLLAASIIVHEFTHYLQAAKRTLGIRLANRLHRELWALLADRRLDAQRRMRRKRQRQSCSLS